MTERQAVARFSQMLSATDPHGLLAVALPIIVRITGVDPFTPILVRESVRGRRRQMKLVRRGRAEKLRA